MARCLENILNVIEETFRYYNMFTVRETVTPLFYKHKILTQTRVITSLRFRLDNTMDTK